MSRLLVGSSLGLCNLYHFCSLGLQWLPSNFEAISHPPKLKYSSSNISMIHLDFLILWNRFDPYLVQTFWFCLCEWLVPCVDRSFGRSLLIRRGELLSPVFKIYILLICPSSWKPVILSTWLVRLWVIILCMQFILWFLAHVELVYNSSLLYVHTWCGTWHQSRR